jgi:hypothetical protein
MRLVVPIIRRLRGRPQSAPRPLDPERLQRIYRETHRHVEELRRAA